ncbi:Serine/threonine-protein phosphatase beta isoform [Tritrichomonas foetus]|uniref:Serine/threonine-protein phosphatase n=1 Tax=Tritrichomonas foetus TaxID=1144522 RepID=A0A1J4KZL1_9EUKA|nr:Serine/threonine-protein phosphatase beta isoform [Tritrichomonas foetus]|eukprot:OHT16697.1 Serine/threonine-protein phosphatase beta isoform [Tritrichomonas foetus]
MEEDTKSIKDMLVDMNKCLQCDVSQVAKGKIKLNLPKFSVNSLLNLIMTVKEILQKEPTIIELQSPVSVVGDLHGHFLDLVRILQGFGLPIARQYLFLGDFVDRGEFSIETVIYVYLLKVNFPEKVFLIRGNHEFEYICSSSGFLNEITEFYGDRQLFYAFIDSFSVFPMAAVIDDTMLAVHGGIGPNLNELSQIKNMQRPITEFGDDVLDSLLWSDPSTEISGFETSKRGSGYLFGYDSLKKFLDSNGLTKLIRGHECVHDGVFEMFNGMLVTVFSASNYCGSVGNKAAVYTIKDKKNFDVKRFQPLPYFKRTSALYPGSMSARLDPDEDEELLELRRKRRQNLETSSLNNIPHRPPRPPPKPVPQANIKKVEGSSANRKTRSELAQLSQRAHQQQQQQQKAVAAHVKRAANDSKLMIQKRQPRRMIISPVRPHK